MRLKLPQAPQVSLTQTLTKSGKSQQQTFLDTFPTQHNMQCIDRDSDHPEALMLLCMHMTQWHMPCAASPLSRTWMAYKPTDRARCVKQPTARAPYLPCSVDLLRQTTTPSNSGCNGSGGICQTHPRNPAATHNAGIEGKWKAVSMAMRNQA